MDNDTPLLVSNHSDHEQEEKVGIVKEFGIESKKLWKIAGPAIFTAICQYSLGALTQVFSGFVGDVELAAVSVENSVVAGLAFGVMVINFHIGNCFSINNICKYRELIDWLINNLAAGNGECTGDAVWASIRCGADQDVGDIHAEIVDHFAGNSLCFGAGLCLVASHS